mmetsp:Transcript_12502/g.29711  ORF Transcript_12502/g.29711 Transcript_12502/m.29711 type:complete len:422 (-) Transcript_12502:603-1868(-)
MPRGEPAHVPGVGCQCRHAAEPKLLPHRAPPIVLVVSLLVHLLRQQQGARRGITARPRQGARLRALLAEGIVHDLILRADAFNRPDGNAPSAFLVARPPSPSDPCHLRTVSPVALAVDRLPLPRIAALRVHGRTRGGLDAGLVPRRKAVAAGSVAGPGGVGPPVAAVDRRLGLHLSVRRGVCPVVRLRPPSSGIEARKEALGEPPVALGGRAGPVDRHQLRPSLMEDMAAVGKHCPAARAGVEGGQLRACGCRGAGKRLAEGLSRPRRRGRWRGGDDDLRVAARTPQPLRGGGQPLPRALCLAAQGWARLVASPQENPGLWRKAGPRHQVVGMLLQGAEGLAWNAEIGANLRQAPIHVLKAGCVPIYQQVVPKEDEFHLGSASAVRQKINLLVPQYLLPCLQATRRVEARSSLPIVLRHVG